MEPIATVLTADHKAIDAHFERFAASLGSDHLDRDALLQGIEGLKHHIWVEEEYHFPPLQKGPLMMAVMVMLADHGAMWGLLDELQKQAASATSADYGKDWTFLLGALETHNAKEEQILYPNGDDVLSAEDAAAVLQALQSGSRPDGWRCKKAE